MTKRYIADAMVRLVGTTDTYEQRIITWSGPELAKGDIELEAVRRFRDEGYETERVIDIRED